MGYLYLLALLARTHVPADVKELLLVDSLEYDGVDDDRHAGVVVVHLVADVLAHLELLKVVLEQVVVLERHKGAGRRQRRLVRVAVRREAVLGADAQTVQHLTSAPPTVYTVKRGPRQYSAVSGAPSMERELIERCVGRAPSVER